LDEERKRQQSISNKKYRDKKKQEKKVKCKAEEKKKRAEEKSTMNWLTEDTDYHTADDEEENKDKEETELPEPPDYVTESGYRPNLVQIPNDYEPGEQGECVICGTRGPVETECGNCPEAVSIDSPTNYLETDVYLIPPIDLTNYGSVINIFSGICERICV
jgi:hypothetical protein